MFIGHFAPAFAARAMTDEAPRLGTLFIAAQLVDWALFLLATIGVEKMRAAPGLHGLTPVDFYHMPITHSLAGTLAFAFGFAALIWRLTRNMVAATWAAVVVASHWLLDLLVHRPDLTLAGGENRYGLALWNRPEIAIPLELALLGLAFWWYWRRTKGPVVPPLILLGLMALFQAVNWLSPAPAAIGPGFYLTALLAFGLLTACAYWLDATRWHKSQVGLAVATVRR